MPDPSLTTNFLVYSLSNALVPFAWRLKHEGMDVELMIHKNVYSKTWDGVLDKRAVPKSRDPANWKEWVEPAARDELIIISDTDRAMEIFTGAPRLYGQETLGGTHAPEGGERLQPRLYIGGWFDGEGWRHPHWLFPDWGVWPGGQGSLFLGALTMFVPSEMPPVTLEILERHTEALASRNFKGLVRVGIMWESITKEWQDITVEAGWPWLQSHAFVWDLPLSSLLMGLTVDWKPHTFTTVLPVSMPPWPNKDRYPKMNVRPDAVPVLNVNQQVRAQMFFHDFQRREKEVWTAGVDGLFGVAVGTGQTLAKARGIALAVANGVALPEKQYRSDAAGQVELMLVGLEDMGLL